MTARFAIVKNGVEIVETFNSRTLADEAFYDLGCYIDESPRPEDIFEVVNLSEYRAAIAKQV